MSNSNLFLILNLGCEMLYVIDQRLQAQSVGLEKSTQGSFYMKNSLINLIVFIVFMLIAHMYIYIHIITLKLITLKYYS